MTPTLNVHHSQWVFLHMLGVCRARFEQVWYELLGLLGKRAVASPFLGVILSRGRHGVGCQTSKPHIPASVLDKFAYRSVNNYGA